MQTLRNVYRLGVKELVSFVHDLVLLVLVVYSFSLGVYVAATGSGIEVRNAAVAIVDEDRSRLSARIADAFLPPYFQPAEAIGLAEIDPAMDAGRYTFVVDIPPDFEADVLAGKRPALQVNVDSTAMSQAINGAAYVSSILTQETDEFLHARRAPEPQPVEAAVRVLYNPNLVTTWYFGVIEMISYITMLAVILTGAALIREREHGTIDHLLVMPVKPLEIMLAKVWANGLVIVVATMLCLNVVLRGVLQMPVAGSVPLFFLGVVAYLFSTTAMGVFLATIARTMPQLGLLFVPVVIPMLLLSGSYTPLESMPEAIQRIMMFAPSTHFIDFTVSVLFRDAGLDIVWRELVAVAVIGALFFLAALWRFRSTVGIARS